MLPNLILKSKQMGQSVGSVFQEYANVGTNTKTNNGNSRQNSASSLSQYPCTNKVIVCSLLYYGH